MFKKFLQIDGIKSGGHVGNLSFSFCSESQVGMLSSVLSEFSRLERSEMLKVIRVNSEKTVIYLTRKGTDFSTAPIGFIRKLSNMFDVYKLPKSGDFEWSIKECWGVCDFASVFYTLAVDYSKNLIKSGDKSTAIISGEIYAIMELFHVGTSYEFKELEESEDVYDDDDDDDDDEEDYDYEEAEDWM